MNKTISGIRKKHNLYDLSSGLPLVPAKEISDSMACPQCGSKLNYRVSSYNGHIHGSCSKNDEERYSCLDWWE